MYTTVECQGETARDAAAALTLLLDALAGINWDDLEPQTLGRLVVSLSHHRDRLDGLCHLAVGAHDRVMAWKADGARSEKEWLAARCGTSLGEAAGRTETARRLGQLPETAQALAEGTISPAHARVATKAARDLPSTALQGLITWSSSRPPESTQGSCAMRWTTTPTRSPRTAWSPSGTGVADPQAQHPTHPR
jgi:hypothetical protein